MHKRSVLPKFEDNEDLVRLPFWECGKGLTWNLLSWIAWVILLLLVTFQTPNVIIEWIHAKRYSTRNNIKVNYAKNPSQCTHKTKSKYIPSELTMRPLDDYVRYQAPFLSFFHTLDMKRGGSVLEIGSGSGRALLDLKGAYPTISVYGTNLRGYGFQQSNGSADALWDVADYFDIPVNCDQNGAPNFPVLLETYPIQSEEFTTLFEPGTFDFIFSRHSLNQGKLLTNESHIFIHRLLPFLKVDSPAMVQMLGGAFHPTSDNKYYPILKIWNIVSNDAAPQRRVSIVLYQTLCYASKFCISVVFKKCAPGAKLHRTYRDCVIPDTFQYDLPPDGWLVSELARVGRLATKGVASAVKRKCLRYPDEYMANFVRALDRWEQLGSVSGDSVSDAVLCRAHAG